MLSSVQHEEWDGSQDHARGSGKNSSIGVLSEPRPTTGVKPMVDCPCPETHAAGGLFMHQIFKILGKLQPALTDEVTYLGSTVF